MSKIQNKSNLTIWGNVRFGHNGFQQRVQIIGRSLPYQKAAENVAFNKGHADRANRAVRGWINSRGHRQNMEGQFDLTGIGVAKNAAGEYYFTQIFISDLIQRASELDFEGRTRQQCQD